MCSQTAHQLLASTPLLLVQCGLLARLAGQCYRHQRAVAATGDTVDLAIGAVSPTLGGVVAGSFLGRLALVLCGLRVAGWLLCGLGIAAGRPAIWRQACALAMLYTR
jgi:hypothetical protein